MKVLKTIMVLSLTLLAGSVYAKGMNKCIINGKTVYTHRNCPTKESRSSFGGGTFNAINVSVNAMRYDAFQRRIAELENKGLYEAAAHVRKRANLAAKDMNYREDKNGRISSSSSARFHKIAEPIKHDAKLKDMNNLVKKSDKAKEDTVKAVKEKEAKLEVFEDEKLVMAQGNIN